MKRGNYYELLEVNHSATTAEIKKAYHTLASKYHPDKKSGNEKEFKKIKEAYETLSDTIKRTSYDSKMKISTSSFSRDKRDTEKAGAQKDPLWFTKKKTETREQELKRIFHDPYYTTHHYFTPRYRKAEDQERAKRAKSIDCKICGGKGFVRYNLRPELGSIGIEERLCRCQILDNRH